MSQSSRLFRLIAASVVGVVLLVVALTVYVCRTDWFREKVRERMVSTVERASGGQVELGSFNYDWHTSTAEFKNFRIHGTEPAGSPPLFRAETVRVGLNITSILKRRVTIASLIVERPQIYLLLGHNGSTNVPSPKMPERGRAGRMELLDLQIRHFELKRGIIYAEAQSVPLSAHADNLDFVLNYELARPQYDFRFSLDRLQVDSARFGQFKGDLFARGLLQKDRIVFEHTTLRSGDLKVGASGTVVHFDYPVADFQVKAMGSTDDVARILDLPELRGGEVQASGAAHYDPLTSVSFRGKIAGEKLAYRSRSFTANNVEFESDILATSREIRFPNLSVRALGGRLSGEAVLTQLRELRLDGTIRDASVREIGRLYAGKALAWAGVASGPLHARGTLDRRLRDVSLQASVEIAPVSGGIPVSGNVEVAYKQVENAVELGESHLSFRSTKLSLSGRLGTDLKVVLDSTDLSDLRPALAVLASKHIGVMLPFPVQSGSTHFNGSIDGPLTNPRIQGEIMLAGFRAHEQFWEELRSDISLSRNDLSFASLTLKQGGFHATAIGGVSLSNWQLEQNSSIRVKGHLAGLDLTKTLREYSAVKLPLAQGIASGAFNLSGSLDNPQGTLRVDVDDLDAYGEQLNQLSLTANLSSNRLQITQGRLEAGEAFISFSGTYTHAPGSWREGQAQIRMDSNGFPLSSLSLVRRYEPGLNGRFEIHGAAAARVSRDRVEPLDAQGTIALREVSVNNVQYGDLTATVQNRGQFLDASLKGDLRETRFSGNAELGLISGTPIQGELHLDRIDLSTIYALLNLGHSKPLPFRGFLKGGMKFEGTLQQLSRLHTSVTIGELQLSPAVPIEAKGQSKPNGLVFRSLSPVLIEASNGRATVHAFQVGAKDTSLQVSGSIAYSGQRLVDIRTDGSVDLRIVQLADPNVQSSGEALVAASIRGTLQNPALTGTLELKNGSFSLNNVPNALNAVNGTIRFDHDRATIQRLTAESGGGELSLSGFVSFASAGPLVYHVEANAENMRLHYAEGISTTVNSDLRLTGTSQSSLLSGTVTVSRVSFNPSTDLGNLLATTAAPAPSPSNQRDFVTGLQMDVHIVSAPNMQLNTALSHDLEAEIDLRLRGRPDHPVLLGNVLANQGDINVFGTKYSINRGQVNFFNPVKIEPVLDLDLQTEARGINVDITVSGTLNKLNINYRSDPPLQPREIVALLTVGQSPDVTTNVANTQVMNDVTALQSGANTVLGQAISPASNRLSKLFGITNVKIDPLVQGITNTPQSRLTVEQQISRAITVTYITNLSETSEQIFRVEWALNRQYSVIALRDDNGEFGIDIQYKKRFK